ncbi:MAG: response regulator [Microscillaceae bacterium]|nr:response regulator [Microscillaceae bacterium]
MSIKLPHILYVEDEAINALIMKKILPKTYALSIAHDTLSALKILETAPICLILMDINLGNHEEEGVQLMQTIRQNPSWQKLPMLALTSYTEPAHKERFLSLGFEGYLTKPVVLEELVHQFQRLLV